jgi:predicted ATP-grasp superfamily ATP-dependent carboligase
MDALVTDVQHRAAVAGLRGLGRSGLRVAGIGTHRAAAGLRSRYCAARAVAATGGDELARTVSRLAAEHGPLVVYPATEEAIEALLHAWGELPASAILPYPGPEVLSEIRDKRRLPELAATAGLRAPETLLEVPAAELAGVTPAAPPPWIAKPATPAGGFHGAQLVGSIADLRAWARDRRFPPGEPLLVQEPVAGPLESLELVLGRDGTVVERFQLTSERTWPVTAGSISFATGVAPDDELIERAARMLAGAGYWGLAHIDFVASPEGPVVLDVNPRFYSCLPLALASGVNLPAAWHAVAVGEPFSPASYDPGVSFRWLEGDLMAALSGHPRRLLQRAPKPRAGAMWAADDPLPAALMGTGIVTMRLRRLLKRGG